MIDTAVAPVAAPPRGRHRRRWIAVAVAAGLTVAAVSAWLVVGLTPHLVNGSVSAPDPEAVAEPPGFMFGPDEQVVTDPSDGSLDGEWSFRNTGSVTIVVSAADQDAGTATYDIHLRLVPPHGGSSIADADVVTVGPGEEFAVAYSWAPGCTRMSAGRSLGTDVVRLHVSALGLSRTVEVHTDQPLVYSTEIGHVPPTTCPS
ncbi:hypothetical protein [Cellulomonas sp. PhB150]|uniref:hypothetical protein n=1 Tax=Cellulomonas sp. PhB150 TaxID=2485188 RepID=UPI000F47FE11|nr:hypothetical protein [Cellulomonas sp. PhB150]